ncbi:hypothetical protein [Paeniglutamicibacter cryotolerans]|uniref:Uncharacterized protein YgiM (DUF1202 family) n=1 Tax=Paeniglutamicibacter cryotolerans TaxID=670079 RepID=A0A839QRC5_9MICC|nr:hypothetical protein [Paeniglutamicibacter cryotolerans]MBB2996536.1 uncharacterized protein YgiM (DUF1202 family) [Paeniglutamicibacter cryotolerans]
MMVVKKASVHRSASTTAGKAATFAAKTLVMVPDTKGSGWAKVQSEGKRGWIPSSKPSQPGTPRFISTKAIAPRAGIKSGRVIATAPKGYTMWGTGKAKSGYVQVQLFGYAGWVPSGGLKRISMANYATKQVTKLRSSAGSGKVLAAVPKAYVIRTTTNTKALSGSRVKVQYRNTTGWLATRDLKSASLQTPAGPGASSYSDSAYASVLRGHVAKWCPGVNLRVTKNAGEYYAESIPLRIPIGRKGKNDPLAPDIKATGPHECAHIKQFKVYPSGFKNLTDRAEAINPSRDGRGIEHLTDCMSDQMGAKRTGSLADGSMYRSGYGGTCTSTQKAAAKALLNGKKPVGG